MKTLEYKGYKIEQKGGEQIITSPFGSESLVKIDEDNPDKYKRQVELMILAHEMGTEIAKKINEVEIPKNGHRYYRQALLEELIKDLEKRV